MISVILSAGMGTRLRPLTDEIPKPLLEINNLTLLERMIGNCMNAGIREFILVVGYKKEKVLEIAPKLKDEFLRQAERSHKILIDRYGVRDRSSLIQAILQELGMDEIISTNLTEGKFEVEVTLKEMIGLNN